MKSLLVVLVFGLSQAALANKAFDFDERAEEGAMATSKPANHEDTRVGERLVESGLTAALAVAGGGVGCLVLSPSLIFAPAFLWPLLLTTGGALGCGLGAGLSGTILEGLDVDSPRWLVVAGATAGVGLLFAAAQLAIGGGIVEGGFGFSEAPLLVAGAGLIVVPATAAFAWFLTEGMREEPRYDRFVSSASFEASGSYVSMAY